MHDLQPLKTWKSELKKNGKIGGDIIIWLKCTKNHNHMMFGSWDIEWDRHNFVIAGHFLPLYFPNSLENQNFDKMKKATGGVIKLHMCTQNHDQMRYASWGMECDRHNFLSFWAIFSLLITPLKNWKIRSLKKWKKQPLIYHHLTLVWHKWQSNDV